MKWQKYIFLVGLFLLKSMGVSSQENPSHENLCSEDLSRQIEGTMHRAAEQAEWFFRSHGFVPDPSTRSFSRVGHSVYQRLIRFRDDPHFLSMLSPELKGIMGLKRVRGQHFSRKKSTETKSKTLLSPDQCEIIVQEVARFVKTHGRLPYSFVTGARSFGEESLASDFAQVMRDSTNWTKFNDIELYGIPLSQHLVHFDQAEKRRIEFINKH